MNDELDARLRQLASEQAASAPVAHDWHSVTNRRDTASLTAVRQPDRRRWLAVAAAIMIVGGVALIAVVATRDQPAPVIGQPDATSETATATTLMDGSVATTRSTDDSVPSTTASTTAPTADATTVPIEHVVLIDGAAVGETWTTRLANSTEDLQVLWNDLNLPDGPPEVDFTTSVVLYFGPAESGSCRFGPLHGVEYDPGTGRLYSALRFEDVAADAQPGECTADANPHAIVVAVDRDDLPATGFDIWVDNEEPPGCCLAGVTRVAAGALAEPTSPPATATPVTSPPQITETAITIPPGSLTVGDTDLFVAHADGDLWLHPGILSDDPGDAFRVADLGDPREPFTEGPGPNVVDQVAGVVTGSVIYGDCCEPAAGQLLAASGPDSERAVLFNSSSPALSPDRSRLAAVNGFGLTVIDLETGAAISNNPQDPVATASVVDIEWSPVGDTLVALSRDRSDWGLIAFDPVAPFAQQATKALDVAVDPENTTPEAFFAVRLAGHGPNGTIAVAITDDSRTTLRHFDATLVERPELQVGLPDGATEVRSANDGTRLVWMIGDELWLRDGSSEPRLLGTGFIAAWFAS